jgi:hypothetical protein
VQAEDLVLNEGRKGEVVKEVGEEFPDISIAVFTETFIVKAIYLCDLTRFVISSKDGYTRWITYLQCYKKSNCLDGKVTAINVVTW